MRYALSRSGLSAIRRFTRGGLMIAFDYDGTLAPIAENRHRAVMRPATRSLVSELARRHPCIVVSGRARADVEHRVRGLGVRFVYGNHGAEPAPNQRRLSRDVQRWLPCLERSLSGIPGVRIENKRLSVSIHYRGARKKATARRAISRAVARLGPVRRIPGKLVVNVLPKEAPDKGVALAKCRAKLRAPRAVYVGDDFTDEDAFGTGSTRSTLSIRVGKSQRSRARYYIRSQRELDRLLRALLSSSAERAASARRRRPRRT